METDARYRTKCKVLYNIINKSCAQGDAHPYVKKFDKTSDGYLAWQELMKYYFGKGNTDDYKAQCYTMLSQMKLDYNTPGGIEHYIANFQDIVNDLEEMGAPVKPILKKTFFLNGILDPYYKAMKTVCIAEQYDLSKCMNELRHMGLQLKPTEYQGRRMNNNMRNPIPWRNVQRMQFSTNNQRGNKGNYLNNYIPHEIWSKMSRADQLEHIKKNHAIREQNQRSKEGQSDAPRPQINYGKQYAIPIKMAKMATNPERISEEYTNIWGPPLTTEGGMQTMKTAKTDQVNFVKTIKP